MEEQNVFQDLPIGKLVCKMAVPIIITMIIQALYNVVDSLFVAQLGIKPLSALGIAYPIQMIMIAVSNGIGIGMNSVVSRRMGNGDIQEAGRATGNAITLALIATATMALFGFFGTNTFFQISTNDTEIIAYGTTYLSICCIFSFGLFLSIIGQRMLQAAGQPTWSMVVQMSGCAFNIIFDPIMIFGLLGFPALGVTGAAIATVGGQILSAVAAFVVCAVKKKSVSFGEKDLKPSKDIGEICKIGAPAAIALAFGSVISFGMNQILKAEAIGLAVFTVFYKLWCFVVMPINGLISGLIPVIGYNFGAKQKERLQSALRITILVGVVMMIVVTLIFQLFPNQLISFFDNGENGEEFWQMGVYALRVISWVFVPFGVGQICINIFQGMGDGTPSLIHALLHQCLLLLPTAWIFLRAGGTNLVWYSFWVAEIIATIIVLIMYRFYYKKYVLSLNLQDFQRNKAGSQPGQSTAG